MLKVYALYYCITGIASTVSNKLSVCWDDSCMHREFIDMI